MTDAEHDFSKRLLLFDIDGTLLDACAGKFALRDSMQSQFGIKEDFAGILLPGLTDEAIARALLVKNGIPVTQENIAHLLEGYLMHLSAYVHRHQGRLIPGIAPLLQHLHLQPEYMLGLLTGNLMRGAEIKLTYYGIWHFFEFGAFSDDHYNRDELGKVARLRAYQICGIVFPSKYIYILGDTPSDIRCGKVIGARTVAVATGEYSMKELAQFKPDFLFDNLLDTKKVLRSLSLLE